MLSFPHAAVHASSEAPGRRVTSRSPLSDSPRSAPDVTFGRIYLKTMDPVAWRRLPGAAQARTPSSALPAPRKQPETQLRPGSAAAFSPQDGPDGEGASILRDAQRNARGSEGGGPDSGALKMSLEWRRNQFKEAGGGSAVDTGDGRGASQLPSRPTQWSERDFR